MMMMVSLNSAMLLSTAIVSTSFGGADNQHGNQRKQET